MADEINSEKAELMTSAKLTAAQSTDSDGHTHFDSNSKPNTGFNVDSDVGLFRISPLKATSQRFVPAVLNAHLLHLFHYFLLDVHRVECLLYDSTKKSFNGLYSQ